MVKDKGKGKVVDEGGKGKRKWSGGGDTDKTGQKRKNRGVLQFFEDRAYEVGEDGEDSSDDSMFDVDAFEEEEEYATEGEVKNVPGKAPQYPLFPKEEDMSEEELERMLEERYKPGSTLVKYAEDEHKRSIERDIYVPSAKDPTIWKVKCMVGRERHSAFCLMQKYVDLNYLGNKLQIISAFAVDHVKGFIFIEADKKHDINEACKGLCTIYSSRVAAVPPNEIHHLLSVRSKSSAVSEGMWARVKNGKYKGDLAQVLAVNDVRKKVTIKLIPRIDLRAMAEKFGGGVSAKRTAVPAPRLITSSELDEFRPLIQYRRDRDTNQMCEVLDGMMLKDGYLFKKVSVDSLSLWGVMPTEDELLKFEPAKNDESNDGQWLSQLFGEQKRPVQAIKKDKGGGKEGGSCSSTTESNFELHDLVFFGRKDFGVVIGTEKDDSVKIIKEGSEGPSVVNVKQRDIKSASFDKKLFTVLDQHSKPISINDKVRVLEGPLKDRQGIVKKIYRGILFLCDESEQENSGYISVKAQLCEKTNLSGDPPRGKDSEPGPSGFEDLPSSPQCPLSPNNAWQERDNISNSKREDDNMFSVGQLLRIRLGPLKGYLCRVLAVRRSEVTVKLDSKHRILTVKSEHLSEVRGRNSVISQGEDSGSVKPFNFLETQDGATDWMGGAAMSTDGEKWKTGGPSTERNSWSAFPTSSSSLHQECNPVVPSNPVDDGTDKGAEGSAWDIKATPDQNSSWGAAVADEKMVANNVSVGSWGAGGLNQDAGGSWNKSGASSQSETGGWGNAVIKLNQPEASAWKKDAGANTLEETAGANEGENENWSNIKKDCVTVWAKSGSSWGKDVESRPEHTEENQEQSLYKGGSSRGPESWSKPNPVAAGGGTSWHKQDGKSWEKQDTSWNKRGAESNGSEQDVGCSWDKKDGASWGNAGGGSWSKQDGRSSWNKKDVGSSPDKNDGASWANAGDASWSKQQGGSSWNKKDGESSWNKKDGESSWGKQAGESSWSQKLDGNVGDQSKGWMDQKDSWESSKGGFGSWKNGGPGNRDADGGSWGRDKSFEGGRGMGGRRGRGGRGGRGQYGRGRSFNEGQSTNWNDDNQHNQGSGDNDFSAGKHSSWSSCQASGSWSKGMSTEGSKKDCLDRTNVSGGAEASLWKKELHANKETSESGAKLDSWDNKSSGWGSSKVSHDNQASAWNRTSTTNEDTGNDQGGWEKGKVADDTHKSSWDTANASKENQTSGWGKSSNSESTKVSDDSQASGWNRKTANEDANNNHGGWVKGKAPDDKSKSSWDTGNAPNENQASGWGKNSNCGSQKPSEGSTSGWKTSGGSEKNGSSSSGWGQEGAGNASNDNQASDWGKNSNWDSQKPSEDNTSGWNRTSGGSEKDGGWSGGWGQKDGGSSGGWGQKDGGSSGGWGQSNWSQRGTDDTGGKQDGGWSSKSNWNSGNDFGGNDAQNDYSRGEQRSGGWRGGREGRGDRGGFRGRGRSDYGGGRGMGRGNFGGRGGADREGGFRGRGGFSSRGRGDWNNRNDSNDSSSDWKKGSNANDEGWKGSSSGGSWNSGWNQSNRDADGAGTSSWSNGSSKGGGW